MDWHLTWQDPVAIGLVVLSLALARWISKRFGQNAGCASCKVHALPAGCGPDVHPDCAPPSGQIVPVDRLRLGRAKA